MITNTYYKAVRPSGASFHDPDFRWLPADGVIPDCGWLVEHPDPAARIGRGSGAKASGYLSLSVEPADCTGFEWPCRLLVVEPVGRAYRDDEYPHKRRVKGARVVAELPAWQAFGPNGEQVAAYLAVLPNLTDEQWEAAGAAWDAARDAAWDAARDAAWYAAWDAAWYAAWDAARDAARYAAWDAARDAAWYAARALVVRDLIAPDHFATLTAPMRAAGIDFDTLTTQPKETS